ncbi:MAG: hypothetical protein HYX27_08195 [Acidobacteria bacterium]|nr:hypothetical protein [Acidobacteriota bacterium]
MLSRRSLLAAAAWPNQPPAERIVLRLPGLQIVRTDWSERIDSPAQPASLWKPFLAAAHTGPPPRYYCDGSQCWLGRRHGWLDLPAALSQSCNQWFHQLFVTLPRPLPTLQMFGLPPQSDADWTQWACPPSTLAHAFAELIARRMDHPLVIAGLRQGAERGTAKSLGRGYLAKTGTGPSKFHSGDGWVVAAHPVDTPTCLVLYRQRGITGAQAAAALAAEWKKERY